MKKKKKKNDPLHSLRLSELFFIVIFHPVELSVGEIMRIMKINGKCRL